MAHKTEKTISKDASICNEDPASLIELPLSIALHNLTEATITGMIIGKATLEKAPYEVLCLEL